MNRAKPRGADSTDKGCQRSRPPGSGRPWCTPKHNDWPRFRCHALSAVPVSQLIPAKKISPHSGQGLYTCVQPAWPRPAQIPRNINRNPDQRVHHDISFNAPNDAAVHGRGFIRSECVERRCHGCRGCCRGRREVHLLRVLPWHRWQSPGQSRSPSGRSEPGNPGCQDEASDQDHGPA